MPPPDGPAAPVTKTDDTDYAPWQSKTLHLDRRRSADIAPGRHTRRRDGGGRSRRLQPVEAAVLPRGLALVGPHPLDPERRDEQQRDEVAGGPQDRPAGALVGQRGGSPRP